jgi:hypothetical protein
MKYAILIYISFSPLALAGNELGNGGDGFAQDFVATGRGMVAELRDNPDPRISDFAAFEKAVSNTHVASTTDPLLLDGQEVDAINYPHEGRITMSRPHWGALSAEKRRALVLHEYLGICCDRSDRNYEISSSYTTDDIPAPVRDHPIDLQLRSGYTSNFYSGLKPDRPTVGITLGWELTHRSTLGLSFDSYQFKKTDVGVTPSDSQSRRDRIMELGANYRYWLNDRRTLRPYLVSAVGLGSNQIAYGFSPYEDDNTFDSPYAFLFGRVGTGAALRISSSASLDLSVNVDGMYGVQRDGRSSLLAEALVGLNVFL